MAARAARHTNKSFALYEALLRLADPETAEDLSGLNLEGFDGYGQPGWEQKLSEAVMDGQEPSVQEEDLWINERMRCSLILDLHFCPLCLALLWRAQRVA